MAANRVRGRGRYLSVGVGSGLTSGAPTSIGQIPGVCVIDAGPSSAYIATIDTEGIYNLAVKGAGDGDSVGTAVVIGDIVYWDATAGHLNVDATDGVRFGYALGAVDSGATTTIPVKIGY